MVVAIQGMVVADSGPSKIPAGESVDLYFGVCLILVAFQEVIVLIYLEQISCSSGSGPGSGFGASPFGGQSPMKSKPSGKFCNGPSSYGGQLSLKT